MHRCYVDSGCLGPMLRGQWVSRYRVRVAATQYFIFSYLIEFAKPRHPCEYLSGFKEIVVFTESPMNAG